MGCFRRTLRIKTSHHHHPLTMGLLYKWLGIWGRFQDGPKPNWRIMTWKDKLYVPEKHLPRAPSKDDGFECALIWSLTWWKNCLYLLLGKFPTLSSSPLFCPSCLVIFQETFPSLLWHPLEYKWCHPLTRVSSRITPFSCSLSWSGTLVIPPANDSHFLYFFSFFHFILTKKLRGR